MAIKIKTTKVKRQFHRRISQGDIFKNVEFIEYAVEKEGIIELSKIIFPHVIVLTQDCDLEQDFKFRWGRPKKKTQDKYLLSVIVAPLYNADHVFSGSHLEDLDIAMEPINKTRSPGEFLMKNERPRYHYLEFPPDIPIAPSIIDFKHYFTVNINYLKKIKVDHFVCQVSDIFREDVSQRFASFLARIGLP